MRVGDKYDMPYVLEKCGDFLESNKRELSLEKSSDRFAWKWIMLADSVGLSKTATACFDALAHDSRLIRQCTMQQISGMSAATATHMLAALASCYHGLLNRVEKSFNSRNRL